MTKYKVHRKVVFTGCQVVEADSPEDAMFKRGNWFEPSVVETANQLGEQRICSNHVTHIETVAETVLIRNEETRTMVPPKDESVVVDRATERKETPLEVLERITKEMGWNETSQRHVLLDYLRPESQVDFVEYLESRVKEEREMTE